jgi:hypothetical protein
MRSEGHNVSLLEVKLACLEVLALGGKSTKDDSAGEGYWVVRAALARAISEAATYIAEKGLAEEGAPPLVRLITTIASRFSIVVTEEVAAKSLSMNNVYTLLLAPRPAGEARATSIPGVVCKERATKPAGQRAAARKGAAAGGHLLRCRSSTIHTDITCVAAPRICPPGARAKVQTLFIDRP